MQREDSFDDVTLFPEDELAINVDTGDLRLIPGVRGEGGMPVEAFVRLYAVRDDEIMAEINSPADLANIVRGVRDEDEALTFVQLFTSPDTHYLFDNGATVIDLRIVPDDTPPAVGAISESLAQRKGIEPLAITTERDIFRIERPLVRAASLGSPREVVRRREQVARGGGYTLVDEQHVATLDTADVLIPYYE